MDYTLIAPTEQGYALDDIKRAALVFEKVYILDQGDRDLFPGNAFGLAMGMPPIMSMPGGPVRPMGKVAAYDADFAKLLQDCAPLIDEGVVEVISSWNRTETDQETMTIGGVPLGGYPLNLQVVLSVYRSLARSDDFLSAAIDPQSIPLLRGPDSAAFFQPGAADRGINGDPALPDFGGVLMDESLRSGVTLLARSRIAAALKVWGVATETGKVPGLAASSAAILDTLATGVRTAIDGTDPDPYWARRNVILDVVMGELFPDDRIAALSSEDLLGFRTAEMRSAGEARKAMFDDIRAMAGERSNLDLDGFRERVVERLGSYKTAVRGLNEQRRAIGGKLILDLTRGGVGSLAGAIAGGGLFHLAFPVSLSSALLCGVAWGIGQLKEYAPPITQYLADERHLTGSNEFAVFRRFDHLVDAKLSKR